jgi:peptidoglycan/xylan/chitin deacetylase (PgdA/CDA1 family)
MGLGTEALSVEPNEPAAHTLTQSNELLFVWVWAVWLCGCVAVCVAAAELSFKPAGQFSRVIPHLRPHTRSVLVLQGEVRREMETETHRHRHTACDTYHSRLSTAQTMIGAIGLQRLLVRIAGLLVVRTVFLSLLRRPSLFASAVSSPGALSSFSPGAQYIVLTFENAELDREKAFKLLEVLSTYKARSTFFVSGSKSQLRGNKDIIHEIHAHGHEIGLIGAPGMISLPHDKLLTQIHHAAQTVHDVTNVQVKFVRPHGGQTNAQINELIRNNASMHTALWNIDAEDDKTGASVDRIVNAVTSRCNPGDVVAFHSASDILLEALPRVLSGRNPNILITTHFDRACSSCLQL